MVRQRVWSGAEEQAFEQARQTSRDDDRRMSTIVVVSTWALYCESCRTVRYTRAMLRRVFRSCASLCAFVVCAGCNTGGPRVEFYLAKDYRFSQAERWAIEDVARSTAVEARQLLPTLPQDLVIRVYAGSDVIPESGESASIVPPATVIWVVDPQHEGGVTKVVGTWLRATLLHEWHHLVRDQTVTSTSLMDAVISEAWPRCSSETSER